MTPGDPFTERVQRRVRPVRAGGCGCSCCWPRRRTGRASLRRGVVSTQESVLPQPAKAAVRTPPSSPMTNAAVHVGNWPWHGARVTRDGSRRPDCPPHPAVATAIGFPAMTTHVGGPDPSPLAGIEICVTRGRPSSSPLASLKWVLAQPRLHALVSGALLAAAEVQAGQPAHHHPRHGVHRQGRRDPRDTGAGAAGNRALGAHRRQEHDPRARRLAALRRQGGAWAATTSSTATSTSSSAIRR